MNIRRSAAPLKFSKSYSIALGDTGCQSIQIRPGLAVRVKGLDADMTCSGLEMFLDAWGAVNVPVVSWLVKMTECPQCGYRKRYENSQGNGPQAGVENPAPVELSDVLDDDVADRNQAPA